MICRYSWRTWVQPTRRNSTQVSCRTDDSCRIATRSKLSIDVFDSSTVTSFHKQLRRRVRVCDVCRIKVLSLHVSCNFMCLQVAEDDHPLLRFKRWASQLVVCQWRRSMEKVWHCCDVVISSISICVVMNCRCETEVDWSFVCCYAYSSQ